ncbi:MAG: hypothetical protein DCF31_08445 [Alphaproteobacteria bacterium]|nr:MAG: hypothetical protein DCF31_08445 [Alphaproteobacteria bacterium]
MLSPLPSLAQTPVQGSQTVSNAGAETDEEAAAAGSLTLKNTIILSVVALAMVSASIALAIQMNDNDLPVSP